MGTFPGNLGKDETLQLLEDAEDHRSTSLGSEAKNDVGNASAEQKSQNFKGKNKFFEKFHAKIGKVRTIFMCGSSRKFIGLSGTEIDKY